MSQININEVLQDLNLDTQKDLTDYMLAFCSFNCCDVRITIAVCKDGDTLFTVDGSCDYDHFIMNPIKGGVILRRLLKEWKELIRSIPSGTKLFCYPTETDGLACRRARMFMLAGFSFSSTDEGQMIYIC